MPLLMRRETAPTTSNSPVINGTVQRKIRRNGSIELQHLTPSKKFNAKWKHSAGGCVVRNAGRLPAVLMREIVDEGPDR